MMNTKIEVRECKIGKGTFAKEPIKEGEQILVFTGPIITYDEAVAKGDHMDDPVMIGINKYVDVNGPELFVNHSCEPNAGLIKDTTLVAIRNIRQGEEITFDYSTAMEENHWTMKCRCESNRCRKVIGNFSDLPNALKQKYLDLGIVQKFITDQVRIGRKH